jgi:hypothetical protein
VSLNTSEIRLGHESLDVTLAYLKGKEAESEEAQEHANSSSLACPDCYDRTPVASNRPPQLCRRTTATLQETALHPGSQHLLLLPGGRVGTSLS